MKKSHCKKGSYRKSREEGEKYAAKINVTAKDENKNKQIKNIKQIKKIKIVQVDLKIVTKLNSKHIKMKLDASYASTRVYICARRMQRTRCGRRGVTGRTGGD